MKSKNFEVHNKWLLFIENALNINLNYQLAFEENLFFVFAFLHLHYICGGWVVKSNILFLFFSSSWFSYIDKQKNSGMDDVNIYASKENKRPVSYKGQKNIKPKKNLE